VERENELSELAQQQQESAPYSVAGAIAPAYPESDTQSRERPNSRWYLGIDFASSGLSATLLDREEGQLHPIYWEAPQAEGSEKSASFRIPSAAVLAETAPGSPGSPVTVKSVGFRQLALPAGEFLLQNFKLPLKVGIPYQREAAGMYEPLLQWSIPCRLFRSPCRCKVCGHCWLL
jgi:hypothetical protein